MRHLFLISLAIIAAFNTPLALAQTNSIPVVDHSQHNVKMQDNVQAPSFVKEYREAMDKMHGPMMNGIEHHDPDAAFVLGMIPHHQGAIDMAKIELAHGNDREMKKLAQTIIDAQKKEIKQLETWLKRKNIQKQN